MNLLLVSDISVETVIGGAERVIYEQGRRLADRGHHVTHITRRCPEHDRDYEILNGIHEYRYRVDRRTPFTFLYSTLINGRHLFENLHKSIHFDCINFHQPFSAFAVCRSAGTKRVKKIYTCHSLAFEEYISRNPKTFGFISKNFFFLNVIARRYLEKRVLQRSDRICVLSRYSKNKLETIHSIPPEKISVIPGGTDINRFSPTKDKAAARRLIGIPEKRLIMLTIRNLVPRMGLENLIQAMAALRKSIPDVYLVIGGDGPMKDDLKSLTKRLDLESHIQFPGFIQEASLPEYYRMADLFVLPTRELEGFGLVTLEAMASGVPVLGTPMGGTHEIIGEFDEDFLFSDATAQAMAEKLETTCRMIQEEPERWKIFEKKCRDYVVNNYDWEQNIQRLESMMDTIGI